MNAVTGFGRPTMGPFTGRGNGAPAPAVGSLGSFQTAEAQLMSARLSTPILDEWYMDFINSSADFNFSITGGATAQTCVGDSPDSRGPVGGIASAQTTAATNGSVQYLPIIASNFAPLASYNSPDVKFGRIIRFRMETVPTADTIAFGGTLGVGAGVFGANTISKYSLRVRSNAVGGQQYITSTVSVDTKWHVLRFWWDGTSFWFQVDSEAPISMSGLGLFPISNATENYYTWQLTKVGNAFDHHCSWDSLHWLVAPVTS
jgi:hypothetical protein